MDYFSIILTLVFLGIAIWLSGKLIKMKKYVTIYGRMFNMTRIMFSIAFVFSVFTMFLYPSLWDLVRSAIMSIAILMFILLSDGLCDDGFFFVGNYVPFSEVTDYDVKKDKKKFIVYFSYKDTKQKSGTFHTEIDFDLKKSDEIEKYLKDKIGKKYRRMRK